MAREKKITYVKVSPIGRPRMSMLPPGHLVQIGEEMIVDADQADFFEAMGMAKIIEEDFDLARYDYATGKIKTKEEMAKPTATPPKASGAAI